MIYYLMITSLVNNYYLVYLINNLFLSNKSTQIQCYYIFTSKWQNLLNYSSHVVYLDANKTFDKIDHDLLFIKLTFYCIKENYLI